MNARSSFLLSALIAASALLSCTKDQDDDEDKAAMITFRSDSGYTYDDGAHEAGDTLHVGALIEEGSDDLRTFYLERKYDGQDAERFDSLPIPGNTFQYDTVLILRDVAGTEKWTFIGVEEGGDRSLRSLTITTQ